MKRIFVVPLAILLLVALIFGGCAKPAPAPTPAPPAGKEWAPPIPGMKPGEEDKYFEWTYTFDSPRRPPPAPFKLTAVENFLSEMEKRTQGRFKIKYAWGGILGTGWEMPQLIGAGIAEISGTPPEWHLADFPFKSMACTWGFNTGDLEIDMLLNDHIFTHPLVARNLDKLNLVHGWSGGGGGSWRLGLRKGVRRIEKVEDLAGLNCWAIGYPALWAKQLGMTPVAVLPVEFYESMQKGMLDVLPWSLSLFIRFRAHEVCGSIVDVHLGTSCHHHYVNKDAWNSLPQYIKDLWWELTPTYNYEYSLEVTKAEIQETLDACEERGIEIYKLPPDEEAKVREAMAVMWPAYVADCEKLPAGQGIREFLKDQIAYRDELTGEHWGWLDDILGP